MPPSIEERVSALETVTSRLDAASTKKILDEYGQTRRIDSLETTVTRHTADITRNEGMIGKIAAEVTTVKQRQETLIGEVGELKTQFGEFREQFDGLRQHVDVRFDAVMDRLDQIARPAE